MILFYVLLSLWALMGAFFGFGAAVMSQDGTTFEVERHAYKMHGSPVFAGIMTAAVIPLAILAIVFGNRTSSALFYLLVWLGLFRVAECYHSDDCERCRIVGGDCCSIARQHRAEWREIVSAYPETEKLVLGTFSTPCIGHAVVGEEEE